MKKKILVVGSLNMDIVVELKRMPLIGETVMGKKLDYIPGGKGANQACALGKLGSQVTMLGCIGNDSFGEKQIDNLTKCNVSMDYVNKKDKEHTGTAVICVDENGANNIVVVSGANSCCDVQYLKEHDFLFKECDCVVFQMEIPEETVYYGILRAKELGKITVLNPAPAPEGIPDYICEKIDYFTPNETELAKIAGVEEVDEENISGCAKQLLEKGIGNILVTMGEKGVLLINKTTEKIFPARKVEAVDTTAAGDCFNGAFVSELMENQTLDKAIEFANLASSVAVTRKGAQSSIPSREEVYSICGAN